MIIPTSYTPSSWQSAGVPGGIPERTTIYTTLSPGVTASDIQTAINNCPANQVVKLAAGTFNVGHITLYAPNNWTLRGEGMGVTILNVTGGSENITIGGYPPWYGSWDFTVNITAGGAQNSTSLTVSSSSSYSVGDLCIIDMDNSGWIVGYGTGGGTTATSNLDSSGKGRDGNKVQLFIVEITGISGNDISFLPALPFDLDQARNPQLSKFGTGARGPRYSGIEDMTLYFNGTTSAGLGLYGTFAFWLKNVEITNWGTFGVWPRWGSCFEMRGCYMHTPNTFDWGKGYGLQLDPQCNCLIIDNIFYYNQDTVLLQGGSAGNVIAYNVIWGSHNVYIGTNWLLQELALNHTPFPCYNLFEGNYTGKVQADYYYGPSGWGCIFRNRITGNGPEIDENRITVSIDAQQRYYSVVGNQLGESVAPSSIVLDLPGSTVNYLDPGTITWGYDPASINFSYATPYIYRLGYPYSGNNSSSTGLAVHDSTVKIDGANIIIHGNWDASNNDIVWDVDISDHDIQNSYFLTSKPSWFGNLSWPPYGASTPSDVETDLAKIPAGYRLLNNSNPPNSTEARTFKVFNIRKIQNIKRIVFNLIFGCLSYICINPLSCK